MSGIITLNPDIAIDTRGKSVQWTVSFTTKVCLQVSPEHRRRNWGGGGGGAAGAAAPATIKLGGGGGDIFLPPPPPTFCKRTKLQF